MRPRLYTVVSSGTCTTELMPLPSLFRQTMVRELVADGGLFFCAPDCAKDRATEDMFAARRIHLPPDGVRGVRSEALLTFSVRQRIKGFKATQEAEDAEASAAIVDISNTCAYSGTVYELMPTLRRNSTIYSFRQKRLLLPAEHFAVNCVPLFCSGYIDDQLRIVDDEVFLALAPRVARGLAGNMMNLVVVGSVLQVALLGNTYHDSDVE